MSCDIGRRCESDLALVRLWHKLAAAAPNKKFHMLKCSPKKKKKKKKKRNYEFLVRKLGSTNQEFGGLSES